MSCQPMTCVIAILSFLLSRSVRSQLQGNIPIAAVFVARFDCARARGVVAAVVDCWRCIIHCCCELCLVFFLAKQLADWYKFLPDPQVICSIA